MNLAQEIHEIKLYESLMQSKLQNIVASIEERLSKVELENVQRISASPMIVIVKASTVFENRWNLSAEYYISESQTNEIIRRIKGMITVEQIHRFLKGVVDEERIHISGNNKMFINTAVKAELIEILKMF